MDTHHTTEEDTTRPRRPPLLPLVIFAGCLSYFGWRYWESGEHIYGLLALINGLGLATIVFRRRH